jgi:small subunit ribosomal protein S15
MLTTAKKQKVIADFGRKAGDTGSPEVQIALLSEQITKLTDHLKDHKKDTHSRRGLIIMVANRRKILNYLKKKDFKTYEKTLKQVGLK